MNGTLFYCSSKVGVIGNVKNDSLAFSRADDSLELFFSNIETVYHSVNFGKGF